MIPLFMSQQDLPIPAFAYPTPSAINATDSLTVVEHFAGCQASGWQPSAIWKPFQSEIA